MSIFQKVFDTLSDGREVIQFTINNSVGASVSVLNFGGIIQSIFVPDKNGKLINVNLASCDIEHYKSDRAFLGSVIGRFANRIGNGRFTLDGKTYQLAINDNHNHLHGGIEGFDLKLWDVTEVTDNSVEFHYFSKDGEENYPGNLDAYIKYSFNDECEFKLEYRAKTDARTVINLTNHAYFNLSGHDSGYMGDQTIMINSDKYLTTDQWSIPTGEICSVEGTPFDLRKETRISDCLAHESDNEQIQFGKGIDQCFVLSGEYAHAATAFSPLTGIKMEVFTCQPGIQFYSANHLNAKGPDGAIYKKRDAFCLETQAFPDAPSHENFPSTVLDVGEEFSTTTVYKFSVK